MKFNYIVLIISIVLTIISIFAYFLFTFLVKFSSIGQDLSISVLSSSIFVVITSIVGYLVEKHQLLLQLYDSTKELQIINVIIKVSLVVKKVNELNKENIKAIIQAQQGEMNKLYTLLNLYYPKKCINKALDDWQKYNNFLDEKLKNIFFDNNKVEVKETSILNELISENSKFINQLKNWLEDKNFKFPNTHREQSV